MTILLTVERQLIRLLLQQTAILTHIEHIPTDMVDFVNNMHARIPPSPCLAHGLRVEDLVVVLLARLAEPAVDGVGLLGGDADALEVAPLVAHVALQLHLVLVAFLVAAAAVHVTAAAVGSVAHAQFGYVQLRVDLREEGIVKVCAEVG